jgi:hypothetical protein
VSKSSAKSGSASSLGGTLFNALALLLVVLSCLCLASVAVVFAMPGLVPESLRVPTEPVLLSISTATFTPVVPPTSLVPSFPATWTPQFTPTDTPTKPPTETPTDTPTFTNTPTFTFTPSRTVTPTVTLTPSKTYTPSPTGPTPTRTRTQAPYNYVLQNGRATYMANWSNSAGCKWLGLAGQVFDLNGRAVQGLYVHLEGGGYSMDGPTGAKPAYGPGGYELYLSDHVYNTTDTYKVQLRDGAGNVLSDWYAIPTFEDCAKNLILVNFTQDH